MSTAAASGARSGFASGKNMPIVRFDVLSHSPAARVTSAGVRLRQRSRRMKNRRQSPSAIASASATVMRSGSFTVSSKSFSAFVRTRSSSAAVIGCAGTSYSVASSVSRAASTESPTGTCAQKMTNPASCCRNVQFSTDDAFLPSTSALYSRPAGSTVMISASASSAVAWALAPCG